MRVGEAKIDCDALIIDSASGTYSVEPKVMKLLQAFAAKPNIVLSREELINTVWGVSYGGDERLSRAISLLRKALGDDRQKTRYIETISRRGYRLIADVNPATDIIQQNRVNEDGQASRKEKPSAKPSQNKLKHLVTENTRFRWLAAGVITTTATFFIMGMTISKKDVIPVSQAMTVGLDHVHKFGHPNAVEEAQRLFTNILANEPDHAAARSGLSLSLVREYTSAETDPNTLKQASLAATRALEIDEHLALAHIAKAWVAEFNHNFEEANLHLDKADVLDPNNALTLEGRFRLTAKTGDLNKAETIIQRAINLHPKNALFHANATQLYSFMNDYKRAEKHALKSIELDPETPRSYAQLSHILHLQNKTKEAIQTIQDGLKINETAALYNNLGTYLFFEGQYELAASAFEKTVALDGNSHAPLYWANLGDAYRWVPGKREKAEKPYRRALQFWTEKLKSDNENLDLKTRIALYKAKSGVIINHQAILDEVAGADDLRSVFYYRALVTAELVGDREKALLLLEKSINAGYPLSEIRNDPELKNLREDAGYHLILAE